MSVLSGRIVATTSCASGTLSTVQMLGCEAQSVSLRTVSVTGFHSLVASTVSSHSWLPLIRFALCTFAFPAVM